MLYKGKGGGVLQCSRNLQLGGKQNPVSCLCDDQEKIGKCKLAFRQLLFQPCKRHRLKITFRPILMRERCRIRKGNRRQRSETWFACFAPSFVGLLLHTASFEFHEKASMFCGEMCVTHTWLYHMHSVKEPSGSVKWSYLQLVRWIYFPIMCEIRQWKYLKINGIYCMFFLELRINLCSNRLAQ